MHQRIFALLSPVELPLSSIELFASYYPLPPHRCTPPPPCVRTFAPTTAHLCSSFSGRTAPFFYSAASHSSLLIPFLNKTAPHSQRTFALVCACLCYIHLPLGDDRNQSEFIRAYQNQSDFLRLVLIDSDKFRFIISNIPPAPYHLQPPEQRTHAYT